MALSVHRRLGSRYPILFYSLSLDVADNPRNGEWSNSNRLAMLVGHLESSFGRTSVARTWFFGTSCNDCKSHDSGDIVTAIGYRDEDVAPVASNHNAFATLSIT